MTEHTTPRENILAFDLEATTHDPAKARIVQVGYVIATPTFTAIDQDVFLVNPQHPIPQEATDVHGITNDDVAHREPFEYHAEHLQRIVDQHQLLAYNSDYDLQVLDRHLRDCGQPGIRPDHPVIDPLRIEMHLNPRTLEAVYQRRTGKTLADAHDALADAKAALDVFQHQVEVDGAEKIYTKDLHGDDTTMPADLYNKLGRDHNGDLVYLFGKHQGARVNDHRDYARWMLKKDFPEQVKDLLRQELALPDPRLEEDPQPA